MLRGIDDDQFDSPWRMVVGVEGVSGVQRIAMSDVDMVAVMRPVHITHTPQQQLIVCRKVFVYFCIVRIGIDHIS